MFWIMILYDLVPAHRYFENSLEIALQVHI